MKPLSLRSKNSKKWLLSKTLFKQKKDLFWSVGHANLDRISEPFLVETILNYGSIEDVKALFQTLGLKKTAVIFLMPRKIALATIIFRRWKTSSGSISNAIFDNIFSAQQKDLLPFISSFGKEFYMVGGTAIALQIGHRQSIDFDLFKTTSINNVKIRQRLREFDLPFQLLFK